MSYLRRAKMNIIKRRFTKCHLIKLTLFVIFLYYILIRKSADKANVLPYVVLHLDLKGVTPKLSYFINLITLLKKLGVTGLLIEYEDMFPFHGTIKNLSSPHSYKADELKSFLHRADQLGMELIPLVQTFGHMDYALKYKEFAHLREDAAINDSICPNQVGSRYLIKTILEQIIEFHNQIRPLKHLHIGCDEVLRLNRCSFCRKINTTKVALVANHVKEVYNIVQSLNPNTKILIWDNMMRSSYAEHVNLNLPITPVAWHVEPKVYVDETDISDYYRKFGKIWIASAYKGADMKTPLFPKLRNRFQNHYIWLKYIQDYRHKSQPSISDFQGIILTGRSKRAYLSPHLELLPTAIPSIVINLLLIKLFKTHSDLDVTTNWRQFYYKYLHDDAKKNLNCELQNIFVNDDPLKCRYMGASIVNELKKFSAIDKGLSHLKSVVFNYTEKRRLLHAEFDQLSFELLRVKVDVRIKMQEWFSDDAAKMYLDQKCEGYNKILKLIQRLTNMESELKDVVD